MSVAAQRSGSGSDWRRALGTLRALVVLAVAFTTLASMYASASAADDPHRPALFRVSDEVVARGVTPFAATVSGLGNTWITRGGGFEPVNFRYKFLASEDAADRVVATPSALTRYDTLREGFLDGAEVRIYRIERERFRLVRTDKVAPGGAHASGWLRVIDEAQVVAPDTLRFQFRWDNWNRPAAHYYFTVRTVDARGNLSDAAPTFEVVSPASLADKRATAPPNRLLAFRPAASLLPSGAGRPEAPRALSGQLTADGVLTLQWTPATATDIAGYVVYRSDYPPQQHSGYFLQLTGKAAQAVERVRAGDMVVVSRRLYAASRNLMLSNRVWNAATEYELLMPGLVNFFPDEDPAKSWALVPHDPASPVEQPGETCLKLRLDGAAKETLSIYNHSGTDQGWYEVLEKVPYKVEVWLRQQGSGTVRFALTGFYREPAQEIQPTVFDVGNGWKKYEAYFTPPALQSGDRPNAMTLEFSGPATFYVDNFRVYQAGTPYMAPLPRDAETLHSAHLVAARTHGMVKTGVATYDMAQLTNPGGVINGTLRLNTLPQTLALLRQAGVRPWLQIEPHMSPEEWLGLIEYLAAPYDPRIDTPAQKPWAYKRYSQGQLRPWSEEFDTIYFELGNETWNSLMTPWTFNAMVDGATGKGYSPGQAYGLFQEYVHAVMQGSPYWRNAGLEDKLQFVLGGWAGNAAYGLDAAALSPSSRLLAIAGYNGGWDEGEGPPALSEASLFDTLAHVSQSAIPVAERYVGALAALNARRARPLRLATYEAGPGYALNGLNGAHVSDTEAAAQEQVMKSLAAGTATLDAFLARAYRGFALQNFFTLDRGELWKSHARWYRGGQAYPSWKLIALFNNEGTGDMLKVDATGVPVADLRAHDRRAAVSGAPLAAVYATRSGNQGDRLNVFVMSRKVAGFPQAGDDGYLPLTLQLPVRAARSITLYRMAGSPRANNLLTDNVRVEKVELAPSLLQDGRLSLGTASGADERGLPPAATLLYVFEGVVPR